MQGVQVVVAHQTVRAQVDLLAPQGKVMMEEQDMPHTLIILEVVEVVQQRLELQQHRCKEGTEVLELKII